MSQFDRKTICTGCAVSLPNHSFLKLPLLKVLDDYKQPADSSEVS